MRVQNLPVKQMIPWQKQHKLFVLSHKNVLKAQKTYAASAMECLLNQRIFDLSLCLGDKNVVKKYLSKNTVIIDSTTLPHRPLRCPSTRQ